MMTIKGVLKKMRVELTHPVTYWLVVGDEEIKLNDFLGKSITIQFLGHMSCIQCDRRITKTFQQGYCFPCMQQINECDNCMLFPERCHVELGTCPTDHWAHEQCYQQHYVYLANSSGLKVGITRHNNIPTRWIDQGAAQALPIVTVVNRRQAGCVEMLFKKHVNDKTNWREMLKNNVPIIELINERDRLLELVRDDLQQIQYKYEPGAIAILDNQPIVAIQYPVLTFPTKVVSHSIDKTPVISGVIQGIKGQYLLLDTGVMNIRKFGGYEVLLS